MKHLANIVTVSRAPIGVAIALLIQNPTKQNLVICLALAVIAEMTDFLDGTIARKLNAVSAIGKALDPLCDSLYRAAVFMGMAVAGWMCLPLLFVFIFRDTIVSYARIFAAQAGVDVAARISGKLKAIVQAIAQIGVLIIAYLSVDELDIASNHTAQILIYIAAAVTFYSAIDYAYNLTKKPQ